ncbi:MAG: FAD:protein FMN transferase [Candidatus Nanopelagicales bacterium]
MSSTDLRVAFRSMASDVRFWVVAPREGAAAQAEAAREVVEAVARSCTRFDPTSDLMRANDAGRRRTVVAQECFDALRAAYDAYRSTDGLFDPRVLRTLTAYGYDMSLPFSERDIDLPTAEAAPARRTRRRWKPSFDEAALSVSVGPEPVDLGGIGKGLAMTWAAQRLRGAGDAVLVEAGGDLMALGGGPDGDGWMVGVENPSGAGDPAAVLRLVDRACATSSIRLRSWTAGGAKVHHLVDPRTGRSAESGLVSVTVVGNDPATCEVWSKSLFVVGREGIRAASDDRGLAALWIDARGYVGVSRAMRPFVDWQVSRVA